MNKLLWLLKHRSYLLQVFRRAASDMRRNPLSLLALKYGSDKGPDQHGYTDVYHELLSSLRDTEFTMLEIGLLNHNIQRATGGFSFDRAPSLEMWREYFPRARIVGFDIADFSNVTLDSVSTLRGDQSSREDLSQIAQLSGSYDLIIDDALHASRHQQVTLGYLFPLLKQGGIYIIEDLHYQPDGTEDSTVATKELLYQLSCGQRPARTALTNEELDYLLQHVESIRFFDSRKRLGQRMRQPDALAIITKR
jgi:hypothetical protein